VRVVRWRLWCGRGKGGDSAVGARPGDAVGDKEQQDLLAGLPGGLAAALPSMAVEVVFVAVVQVRAGRSTRDLARQFGLSIHDAKTIVAYCADTDPGSG
jgi:hypothetical protein